MIEPQQAPTRAALQELRAERSVVREAYAFLDEKRLLLAAEILAQLRRYETLRGQLEARLHAARAQLRGALQRHGLQGLEVYPAAALEQARLATTRSQLMGVTLLATELHVPAAGAAPGPAAGYRSAGAEACRGAFRELAALGAELAGVSGNLYRLFAAYRATERRARALENIILPDIEKSLAAMTGYLEEVELEEAIRARPLRPPW